MNAGDWTYAVNFALDIASWARSSLFSSHEGKNDDVVRLRRIKTTIPVHARKQALSPSPSAAAEEGEKEEDEEAKAGAKIEGSTAASTPTSQRPRPKVPLIQGLEHIKTEYRGTNRCPATPRGCRMLQKSREL